jgi:hypothetical protein
LPVAEVKETDMAEQHGRPPDDVSSAPESGTVRDGTSGNQPSDRNFDPRTKAEHERGKPTPGEVPGRDDPSFDGAEP